jgi:hypothetical protein
VTTEESRVTTEELLLSYIIAFGLLSQDDEYGSVTPFLTTMVGVESKGF